MVALTTNSRGQTAKQILEEKIEVGRISAQGTFERIMREVPEDSIVSGRAMAFAGQDQLRLNGATIHKHALSQLAQRAGVPGAYLADLAASSEPWQRTLVATVLGEHYREALGHQRFLVRSTSGHQVRGVLSDKYRRLDNRPLIEAFATGCQASGAVPVDGHATDTRVSIKALYPRAFEVKPGEAVAFGLEWGNSDYGAATHSVRAFVLRLWCLNGATTQNALRQVHLGRGISDDMELSARTIDLDTRASISAMGDIIRASLTEGAIEHQLAGLRQADEKSIEWRHVSTSLGRKLLKGELDRAKEIFEGDDVVNLPEGRSLWRVSNAVSWLAGKAEGDRKLELERLAGEVLTGNADAA